MGYNPPDNFEISVVIEENQNENMKNGFSVVEFPYKHVFGHF